MLFGLPGVSSGGTCPAGQVPYYYGGCTTCYSGTYDAGTYCASCPAGRFNPSYGSPNVTACKNCTLGYFTYTGYSYCQYCYTGYYCPTTSSLFQCPAGRYGSSGGLTSSSCSGPCLAPAGSYCQQGATQPTGYLCGVGTYSLANATYCTSCPAGRFGDREGLPSAACSGLCPAGQWSTAGSSTCQPCKLGSYGAAGATESTCSGVILKISPM